MKRFLAPLAAFGSGLAVITIILACTGSDPAETVRAFFTRPFSSMWYVGNMLDLAGLLMLAGAGSALAMKGGTFNLGGEAQLYAPAFVTAAILSASSTALAPTTALPAPAVFAFALFAAAFTGALLGFIPGILKARFGTNELIVSFLLSAAIVPVLDYLVAGPFRDTGGSLIATPAIDRAFRLTRLLAPSTFNVSFFVAVLLALASAFLLKNTVSGYRYRMTGAAPEFARFAGFRVKAVTVSSMTLSGLFHGLAGFFAIAGTWFMCHQGLTAGMGWSALAVALIAKANPLAVIPSALLYAWLETASDSALLSTATGFDTTSIVQAVIFLVVSAQFLPGIALPGRRQRK